MVSLVPDLDTDGIVQFLPAGSAIHLSCIKGRDVPAVNRIRLVVDGKTGCFVSLGIATTGLKAA